MVPMPDECLLAVLTDRYFPLRTKIRSEDTRRQYRFAINDYAEALGRPPTLGDLTDDGMARLMVHLTDRGLAEITINERVGRITALWRWLAKRGVVSHWPTIEPIPVPERIPRAWTQDELRSLFASVQKELGHIGGVLARDWWLAFLAFTWCTSERRGATLAMTWKMVNLTAGVATLPPAIRKGRKKAGVYDLWPEVVELLREIRQPPRELVFPFPFDNTTYYNHFSRILRRAGLPVGRAYKTHAIRVSHATWRELLHGDSTDALGHDNPATTRKSYIDPRVLRKNRKPLFIPWLPEAG